MTLSSDPENRPSGASPDTAAHVADECVFSRVPVEALRLDRCHSCALHEAGIDDDGLTVSENVLQQRRYAYNVGQAKMGTFRRTSLGPRA